MQTQARIKYVRTQLTMLSDTLDLDTREITVHCLLGLLDHLYDNPDELDEFIS